MIDLLQISQRARCWQNFEKSQ